VWIRNGRGAGGTGGTVANLGGQREKGGGERKRDLSMQLGEI